MNRMFAKVAPAVAAVMLLAGPAIAAQKVTCQQIQAALASGKKVSAVAKEFKVSTRRVEHCKSASMEAAGGAPTGSKSTTKSH